MPMQAVIRLSFIYPYNFYSIILLLTEIRNSSASNKVFTLC